MKQVLGYLLGFCIFIAGIPALMWWVAGRPAFADIPVGRLYLAAFIALAGLALSIWSIVHMKRVGKGNPFDAMGHEVAPRTRHLMTGGPYRLSRNPMLSGTFLYLLGWSILFDTWQAFACFMLFVVVMLLQVRSEEKRLRRDFGEEYEAYCRTTGRFFPKRKKHVGNA